MAFLMNVRWYLIAELICVTNNPNPHDKTSLVAQTVKRLPTMRETGVPSHGSGRTPGEGNGTPLQYSCLENPMDGGAW